MYEENEDPNYTNFIDRELLRYVVSLDKRLINLEKKFRELENAYKNLYPIKSGLEENLSKIKKIT